MLCCFQKTNVEASIVHAVTMNFVVGVNDSTRYILEEQQRFFDKQMLLSKGDRTITSLLISTDGLNQNPNVQQFPERQMLSMGFSRGDAKEMDLLLTFVYVFPLNFVYYPKGLDSCLLSTAVIILFKRRCQENLKLIAN